MITVKTVALHGLTGHMIRLIATAAPGEERITFTGDGDPTTLLLRVLAALDGAGERDRHHQVEVRLDPVTAQWPDAAAVAVAMLAAANDVPAERLAGSAVLGEVGLDGGLRPTRGTVSAVQAARAHGIRRVIVPAAAAREALLIDGAEVLAGRGLSDVAAWLRGDDDALSTRRPAASDLTDHLRSPARPVSAEAREIAKVAATGGHHLLIDGADNAATGLVAQWLHQLLPDLTPAQQLDVAVVRSLTGPHLGGVRLSRTPPMVNLHPSRLLAALIGGTAPGAGSEAHHGLLVARELGDFSGAELDALRSMMCRREVSIARGGRVTRYPAGFQLLATHTARASRLAPVLVDAFDMAHSLSTCVAEPTDREQEMRLLAQERAAVCAARARSVGRWRGRTGATGAAGGELNATVPAEVLHAVPLPAATTASVQDAQQRGVLSVRGGDAVLRLAWTLADLAGADVPSDRHVRQALSLRNGLGVRRDSASCGVPA
ncbi:magnesium chelatase family protein [Lentzea atacamensis]|uniref:Magnesium chelatase family protein n=1 Tax=Lentzea atacamensis TaxID=531938 RepID=A0ABX9DWN5_9PSEU|nr:ATP-binding protein [Lentzea atacamensis]RAS59512.1 magnesium chelatase family protein [Lentzea atacamensis]